MAILSTISLHSLILIGDLAERTPSLMNCIDMKVIFDDSACFHAFYGADLIGS